MSLVLLICFFSLYSSAFNAIRPYNYPRSQTFLLHTAWSTWIIYVLVPYLLFIITVFGILILTNFYLFVSGGSIPSGYYLLYLAVLFQPTIFSSSISTSYYFLCLTVLFQPTIPDVSIPISYYFLCLVVLLQSIVAGGSISINFHFLCLAVLLQLAALVFFLYLVVLSWLDTLGSFILTNLYFFDALITLIFKLCLVCLPWPTIPVLPQKQFFTYLF